MAIANNTTRKIPRNINYIIEIIDYFNEIGIIDLPSDFKKQLIKESFINFTDGGSFPSKKSIASVVLVCENWKKYIDTEQQQQYTQLIVAAVKSMFRINCCVISAPFLKKNGIKIVNKLPTPGYKTIISDSGFIKEFYDEVE